MWASGSFSEADEMHALTLYKALRQLGEKKLAVIPYQKDEFWFSSPCRGEGTPELMLPVLLQSVFLTF